MRSPTFKNVIEVNFRLYGTENGNSKSLSIKMRKLDRGFLWRRLNVVILSSYICFGEI